VLPSCLYQSVLLSPLKKPFPVFERTVIWGCVVAKFLILLLFAITVQGLLSPRASAQDGCSVYTQYCAICGDPVLPGLHSCESESGFIASCELPAWWCAPAAAPSETAPKVKCNVPSTPTCGHPINLANGNTYIIETDTSVQGLGGGLTLTRQWNSLWPSADSAYQIGMFGPNWRSTYEERVFVGSDNYFKYLQGDGSIWSFGYGPGKPAKYESAFMVLATPVSFGSPIGATVGGPGGGGGAAVYIQPTYFAIFFGNGEQKRFDIDSGKLIAIVDRNGNETSISYDSLGRLSTVTSAAGQHLYFGYGTGSGSLVTGVTSDFGVSMSYSYDTEGRLTQVTEPDSTTISYVYNSLSQITSVLDSNSHVLEAHTYDASGRGLTSSRADGVDAVTLSYSN
jgi:YD repeat-containing protein